MSFLVIELIDDVGLVESLCSRFDYTSYSKMNAVSIKKGHAVEIGFIFAYVFDEIDFMCWNV